jgi:DNA-binding MarR family transcriptional regulator
VADPAPEPAPGQQDRPIGWWLKEANRRLDGAFDRALEGQGSDRRRWQVLASLARRPESPARLVELLSPFDPPAVVSGVVADLTDRGLIEEAAGLLRLTESGRRVHEALSGPVAGVRRQVRESLPGEDYATLLRLLGRLAEGLAGNSD